jgi:hypothetical protein
VFIEHANAGYFIPRSAGNTGHEIVEDVSSSVPEQLSVEDTIQNMVSSLTSYFFCVQVSLDILVALVLSELPNLLADGPVCNH